MLIDSHCHLQYKGLVEDQQAVLDRARSAGVHGMLNISTRIDEWDAVVGTAQREPDVWASVGIHPHEADAHEDLGRDRLLAARETGLPVIIHTRDAEDDTAHILAEEMGKGTFPALIHCFTASADFARKVLDMGLTISISGIVTFKNAKDLQGIAKDLPADRLLVETDSPFLAPVPHRGKPCEPAFVRDTATFLADLRQVPLEKLADDTTRNFHALFTRAGEGASA